MPVTDTTGITSALTSGGLAGADLVTSCTSIDGTADYSYDPTGQLVGAAYTGGQSNEAYSYDANGNRTSANGSTYVTGPDNELLSDGTYTYTYDAEGNRTAKFIDANGDGVLDAGDTNITEYTWDARGRLVEVTDRATAGGPATEVVDYVYDAENRWIGETISVPGQAPDQIRFVYDGNQIVLEFDKNGSGAVTGADLSHRYLWQPNAVDQVLADEHVTNPQSTGNVVWPLADNLGTVRDLAVFNAATGLTTIVAHRVYSAYGQLISQTNPSNLRAAAVDCLFGFTGRPFDPATGLQNNLNRWYDPATGNWLTQDPTGFAAGDTNLYRYCGNSPTCAVDPSGTTWNPGNPEFWTFWFPFPTPGAPTPPAMPPGAAPAPPAAAGTYHMLPPGSPLNTPAWRAQKIYLKAKDLFRNNPQRQRLWLEAEAQKAGQVDRRLAEEILAILATLQ